MLDFIAEIVVDAFFELIGLLFSELIGSLFSGVFRDSSGTLAPNGVVFPALKQ